MVVVSGERRSSTPLQPAVGDTRATGPASGTEEETHYLTCYVKYVATGGCVMTCVLLLFLLLPAIYLECVTGKVKVR